MNINDRIFALREQMKKHNIDAYIIPSEDSHQTEYVGEHWKSRAWISGFTGSAGTVVVTMTESGLWTDGRYFIQAEKELSDSEIKLFKATEPGVPSPSAWLGNTLTKNATVGIDGKLFTYSKVEEMKKDFRKNNISINSSFDLIDPIWSDRPSIPETPIFFHEIKYAGKTTTQKLSEVQSKMDDIGADYYILSTLDDIAWLFNIRGRDIENNTVVHSYAVINKDGAVLFIDKTKVNDEITSILSENKTTIKGYDEILNYVSELPKGSVITFDGDKLNTLVVENIPNECETILAANCVTNIKSVKNEVEISNLRKCHQKDNIAVTKFLNWLDKNVPSGNVTELDAAAKLTEFRSKQEGFISPSFSSIAAYRGNAALMHYRATEKSYSTLKPEHMFLIDSGGQYPDGTTDITRTIVLGDLSQEEKEDFSLVLKSHIALCNAKFLYGATGTGLDMIARQPMWERGIDYKSGTGHGVGFCLGVHEGPQRFRMQVEGGFAIIEEGMVLTNEPGIYKQDRHGIRIENTLLTVFDRETEFGRFLKFEVLSYCPIDIDAIVPELLSDSEREWLNNYHVKACELLSPHMNEEELEYLKKKTKAI